MSIRNSTIALAAALFCVGFWCLAQADGISNSGVTPDAVQSGATPTNPTGTSSATPTMAGIGTTCTLTPSHSTRAIFTIQGILSNTLGDPGRVALRFGSGTAPANGAAATGTALTNSLGGTPSSTGALSITLFGVATGLVPGTAYWYDFSQLSPSGGTTSLANIACNAYAM